jgi:hypothetical protein
MSTARSLGRIVGVLFLVQGTIAPVVNFRLLAPALTAGPGFLVDASAHSAQVYLAAVLMLVTGAIWAGIALLVLPIFRQYSERMALAFVAITVVCFSGVVFEAIAVRSMLALSRELASAGAADAAAFQASAAVARSLRSSAHYTNLLLSGVSFLVFYGLLLRFALIPRVLSALGLLAALILMVGAVIPLFGQRPMMQLFMPVGLSQLAIMLWLLAKGFAERPLPRPAEKLEAEPI